MKRYILYILFALMSLTSQAQIRIGGDVYGGGKEGAVCVGNTKSIIYYTAEDATAANAASGKTEGEEGYIKAGDVKTVPEKTAVTLTKADSSATSVIIAGDANVRTVFGGGRNGRVYGQTNVTVEGGTVGAEIWNNTIHGGVFGAGDGATAYVFGKQNSTIIKGGTIYNNIYGGGNQADLMGTTCVTLQGGLMKGSVFGGARMANIWGYSYVNLDGANVADDSTLVVPKVYGGNDISGNIATGTDWTWTQNMDMPFESILKQGVIINPITGDWDAFVHATAKQKADESYVNNIFVGEVFGGGNGDYEYQNGSLTLIDTLAIAEVKYTAEDQEVIDGTKNVGDVKTPAVEEKTKTFTGLIKPEVKKAYLDIQNGTYGNLYGGGNNATVTESVDICLFQQANKIVSSIPATRISEMGLSEDIFKITGEGDVAEATPTYQFDRVFGGNNKAEMKIRPNWYLARGTINSLYSGGNMGAMTAEKGIILPIASDGMYVNNCFGGCRLADVRPQQNGTDVALINEETITSYKVKYSAGGVIDGLEEKKHNFEAGYAARVFVMGGHIDNVYGGNDISGKVYFGTNVAINGAVSGNVYGGGNGSYAYTDKNTTSDYYYKTEGFTSSIDALNAHRPHVENTLVHIWGDSLQQPVLPDIWEDASNYSDASNNITTTGAAKGFSPVIVTGGVYCGGNSATLEGNNAKATFKIGTNVIINSVFLGSNGEDMVTKEMLQQYADDNYSSLNLTVSETFEKYMSGCAVDIRPTITYDWKSGEDPHTYIGSLFGGGNVGSVTYAGPVTITMPEGLKIYNHVVGGCNNANVPVVKDGSGNVLTPELKDDNGVSLDMAFEGGFITKNSDGDASKPKVTINMNSYLEPRKLEVVKSGVFLESAKLPWSVATYFQTEGENYTDTKVAGSEYKALESANVYGGCYTSGIIKGDVTVNITHDLVSPAVFNLLTEKNTGDAPILNGWTAADEFKKMGSEAMTNTMLVYGGGYGEETTIDGDVHVNLSGNARTICVLGGAEEGDITGSTYVTAAANMKDYTDHSGALPFNSVAIYAGAYAGPIEGHTELRLNGGTFLNAFGGSCNADIEGYASAYIGDGQSTGYPFIKGYVFGGNDFGGYINGYKDYSGTQAGYDGKTIRSPRYVEYNSGRIGDVNDSNTETALYGGSFGLYDYTKYYWSSAVYDDFGEADYEPNDGDFHYPLANETVSESELPTGAFITNTYVNILCQSSNKDNDVIKRGIFGGGRGVMEMLGIVDTKQTYVYLHGKSWAQRGGNLSADTYGGGYYSIVENTKVDLESGCTGVVYGGSYGTSAKNLNTDTRKTISYNSTRTEVNLYAGMDNAEMRIFGGGGYAGATETFVNLYGGKAHNVYGGSYNEGYCQTTHIDVPSISTANVNAIFGGGYGSNVALPCDEETTNVTFASAYAYVADAIYGGNNDKRAARYTNITIDNPVKNATTGALCDVYGGGNGASTVCGETNVTLNSGAQVKNLYGGGRDGKVYGYYVNTTGAATYYVEHAGKHAKWDFIPATTDLSWEGSATYIAETPAQNTDLLGYYTKEGEGASTHYRACASGETANGTTTYYRRFANTNLTLNQGATAQNVFAGGCGANATVCGTTRAHMHGGSVVGDGFTTGRLFGGGESGNVRHQSKKETAREDGTGDVLVGSDEASRPSGQENNVYTYTCLWGGDVTTVYGGGFKGYVGDDTNPAETRVEIGEVDKTDHYAGCPAIQRGVYGGGYSGAVYGTAKVQMLNGYVGYDFTLGTTTDSIDGGLGIYTEKLKSSDDDLTNKMKENGNLFGGGYGEGATTDHTIVNMMGGTIRNSLYGGGEIASVGRVSNPDDIDINDRSVIPNITVAGSTEVNMYSGLVSANVFGGGRGYAIDAYGNTLTGEKSYSDGYVFGKTNVNIHRGTIGTPHTLANGDGNVFGGGNIGFVYGADSSISGTNKNVTKGTDKYYHVSSDGTGDLSEDCKVVIAPVCRVDTAFGDYQVGDYVPYEVLNEKLVNDEIWTKVDKEGVKILNAVFAGGNVSRGSDKIYANTKTIYGNATASVTDIFSKDLITIGGEGIGGLYGDGSLTFVDGYREVNVSNYGTDYYNLTSELTVADYYKLTDRERAYFELLYKNTYGQHKYEYYEAKAPCVYTYKGTVFTCSRGQKITKTVYDALSTDDQAKFKSGSKTYSATDKINDSEYNLMDADEKEKWTQAGFCTLYAGRMLNTIQRADFCGVFGSRIVLKGAQDRVPSVVDYTNYTLNRIHELSLNQRSKTIGSDSISHGNYFGIYSVVNYLGALTSDVDFFDTNRTTSNDNDKYQEDPTNVNDDTYAGWKKTWINARKRNNGSSPNEVALSSGVWLEIVDESTDNNRDPQGNIISKNYGPITGVIQLDLVNVATGEGGGYVYAKNVHGVRTTDKNNTQITLTSANTGAISQKMYTYADPVQDTDKMQSSGNFVNSVKRIIDDCFPRSSSYVGDDASPAHYWFVRGDFYVYDQYISAFTGASQAYSEKVSIPLTITAESHGRLKLESVNENHYAYWTDEEYDNAAQTMKPNGNDGTLLINGLTYTKNQPISYYDYNHLTDADKLYFEQMTYICTVPCELQLNGDTVRYAEGDVISPTDYQSIMTQYGGTNGATPYDGYYICTYSFSTDDNNLYTVTQMITAAEYNNLSESSDNYTGNFQPLTYCFHPSNEISHDKGYILTFDWDNPDVWNQYYHKKNGDEVKRHIEKSEINDYALAPTYKANVQSSIYGQTSYGINDVVDLATYTYQTTMESEAAAARITVPGGQAKFELAYVAKEDCKFTIDENGTQHTYTYVKGAPISMTLYDTFGANKSHFEPGYLVTETYEMSSTKQYLFGEIIPQSEYNGFTEAIQSRHFSAAYICTEAGKWGGQVFVQNNNYGAAMFGNLLPSERGSFVYNYDALDLLSENFSKDGVKSEHYQGAAGNHANDSIAITNQIGFCKEQLLDYTAVYSGNDTLKLSSGITLKRNGTELTDQTEILRNDTLTNEVYENLTNHQANYAAIEVKGGAIEDVYYVVKQGFQVGDRWYSPGKVVSADIYDNLAKRDSLIAQITKEELNEKAPLPTTKGQEQAYYFCSQEYTDAEGTKYAVGTLLSAKDFQNLPNEHLNFDVIGPVPSETATLYVARGTDIKDLMADKIVTPIYYYEYVEADDEGNYETVRERHIINIHIHFESGVPTVGELLPPSTVLPGTSVGLNQPSVAKGAYEILGGGWEMFTDKDHALSHRNGVPYTNNNTKMYWYQDGYYVAYYAKSYLGKTYSNPVMFSVANYHDIEEVLTSQHTENEYEADGTIKTDPTTGNVITKQVNDYMYINEAVAAGKRNPKIYIGDTKNADGKSELTRLADLYTLTSADAVPSNLTEVINCANLDFLLKEDVHQTTWTSVGTEGKCFAGNVHGNGHAISGLTNSLFGYFGGNVYNLGVAGSFTGGGIADHTTACTNAHAYNCWVATKGTPAADTKAIFADAGNDQLFNCYYPLTSNYEAGQAIGKPLKSFLDGEVAYNLNSFYLTARHHRLQNIAASGSHVYNYYELNSGDLLVYDETTKTNRLNAEKKSMSYDNSELVYSEGTNKMAYVEDYIYSTPDFLYADGKIPASNNIRRNAQGEYHAIFPDDYIFFGQNLSYNIVQGGGDYVDHPQAVRRQSSTTDESKNTKLLATDITESNRVYRAPAYYKSNVMSTAHFNQYAAFAGTMTLADDNIYGLTDDDKTQKVYKDLTAIDFTGNGDTEISGDTDQSAFYKKFLDYNGLLGYTSDGLTRNLLVYADPTNDATSYGILSTALPEATLSIDNNGYNEVALPNADNVKGHLVDKTAEGTFVATRDHYLVDKENFNCPISYSFSDNGQTGNDKEYYYMWYQRKPNYVDASKGWEAISLPFTADLVSTQDKGEITHFYQGSTTGHEYWLREFKGQGTAPATPAAYTFYAAFNYPSADASASTKDDANTFLWDYYYSYDDNAANNIDKDKNEDDYQNTYYNSTRTYANYPLYTAAVPYIIGFPGSRYYEFDLSGTFVPKNRQNDITKLDAQTISFVSVENATIKVSDDEITSSTKTEGVYSYIPNYMDKSVAAGAFMLNSDGSSFDKTAADKNAVPFRPYFTKLASPAPSSRTVNSIVFTSAAFEKGITSFDDGNVQIYNKSHDIYIENGTSEELTFQVTTLSGIHVCTITVGAHSQEVTRVNNPGVYLVGRKKLFVK